MNNDDERLSAYLDNELAPEQRAQLEQRLSEDGELATRLQQLKATTLLHKASVEATQNEPLPADIERLLQSGAKPAWWSNLVRPVMMVPASVAFSALFVFLIYRGFGGATSEALIDAPLAQVLDTSLSGNEITLNEALRVDLILSFKTHDDRWCREFTLIGSQTASRNVACKGEHGWQIEATDALAQLGTDTQQYRMASGDNAQNTGAFYAEHAAGDVLSIEAERALLDDGSSS